MTTKLQRATQIRDQILQACLARKNGKSGKLTLDQWRNRAKCSAYSIVDEMDHQIQTRHFNAAALHALRRRYRQNFTGANYASCFQPLGRWPNGRDAGTRAEGAGEERRASLSAESDILEPIDQRVRPARRAPQRPARPATRQWVVLYDDHARLYYGDLATGEAQWERPATTGRVIGERVQDWTAEFEALSGRVIYTQRGTGVRTQRKPAAYDFSHIDRYDVGSVPLAQRGVGATNVAWVRSAAGPHIECDQQTPTIDATTGNLVNGPLSEDREGPLFPEDGDDAKYVTALAAWAVRETRRILPKGTFNNTKADGSYACSPESPLRLYNQLNRMSDTLSYDRPFDVPGVEPADPLSQLAGRVLATVGVGGGVCSALSAVVAALIASRARTEYDAQGAIAKHVTVLVVSHNFDHSFAVVKYGNSPWIVADPWPASAYVMPWRYCQFGKGTRALAAVPVGRRRALANGTWSNAWGPRPAYTRNVMELRILRRVPMDLDRPFGVTLDAQRVANARTDAGVGTREVGNERMQGVYFHPSNLDPAAPNFPVIVTEDDWGQRGQFAPGGGGLPPRPAPPRTTRNRAISIL